MSYLLGLFLLAFLGFLGFPKGSKLYQYSKNLLLGYDQWLNTLLGGYPDETISSRAYKGKLRGSKTWGLLANILDWIDPGHTEEAVEWDEGTDNQDVPLSTSHDNKSGGGGTNGHYR